MLIIMLMVAIAQVVLATSFFRARERPLGFVLSAMAVFTVSFMASEADMAQLAYGGVAIVGITLSAIALGELNVARMAKSSRVDSGSDYDEPIERSKPSIAQKVENGYIQSFDYD